MNYKKLEKTVRGFSNHRRIQILELLYRHPGLSLLDIADRLKINFKTTGSHMQRLVHAGIVNKENDGALTQHTLTKLGKSILLFLRTTE